MPKKVEGKRLSDHLRRFLDVGHKLLKMSESEAQERAISAHRLMEKLWYLISWDEWLIDVLYENGNFTAIVYDEDANLYAYPVILDGDDVSLGEPVRVSESFDVIPESDSQARQLRSTIQVFRQGEKRYWIMRACTSVMNRVGEIDSSKLFDSFIDRFYDGNHDTPFLTLRHKGEVWKMGETIAVMRDGVVLVTVGVFDDTPLADIAFESIERDADYWGVSIGYGFDEGDALPELISVKYRTDDKEISIPIPVYNEGTLVEQSILGETEAASFFTSINRMEVSDTMPQKRIVRDFRKDLGVLFGDDPKLTELLDGVADGTTAVNELVAERQLIRRSATDDNTDDNTDDTDDTTDDNTDDNTDDTHFDVDDDMLTTLTEQLAGHQGLIDGIASRLEVSDDPDSPDGDDTLREFVAGIARDLGDVIDTVNELVEASNDLDDNRQRRSINVRRKGKDKGDGQRQSQRPRDKHRKGSDDPLEDYEESLDAFESHIADIVSDL